MASCRRGDTSHPTAEQCRAGCERVARWKIAGKVQSLGGNAHEADENVDVIEAKSKRDIELLKQQIAEGIRKPLDPHALAKLSAKDRKAAIEQHEFHLKQLRAMREQAIQHAEDALADAKKTYQKFKDAADNYERKAMKENTDACAAPCVNRTVAYAECLLRTQAVQDVAICEKL